MLLVTYQKENGCIIKRKRKTMLPYKVGQETSMGWKVLNIEYEYDNKYYQEYEYNMLIYKRKQKCILKQQKAEIFKQHLKAFMYYFIAVAVVNGLKFILGIR